MKNTPRIQIRSYCPVRMGFLGTAIGLLTSLSVLGCAGNTGMVRDQAVGIESHRPVALEVMAPVGQTMGEVEISPSTTFTVKFLNRGTEAIWVNHRGDMQVELTDIAGFRYQSCANLGPPESEYVKVEPGMALDFQVAITTCHNLEKPGKYSVIASFRDRASPSAGVHAISGPISSRTTYVRFIEPGIRPMKKVSSPDML